jgi:hypothetical protein
MGAARRCYIRKYIAYLGNKIPHYFEKSLLRRKAFICACRGPQTWNLRKILVQIAHGLKISSVDVKTSDVKR